mmetsp:Transcript_60134/g.140541  ORF Transcript_60134/g.140541 Transcript_60134/m.140541 type:complete len:217 (-) Transcript_60134:432-1082(-)
MLSAALRVRPTVCARKWETALAHAPALHKDRSSSKLVFNPAVRTMRRYGKGNRKRPAEPKSSFLKGPRTYSVKAPRLPYQLLMASWMYSLSNSMRQPAASASKVSRSCRSFLLLCRILRAMWIAATAGDAMRGQTIFMSTNMSATIDTQRRAEAVAKLNKRQTATPSTKTGAKVTLPVGLAWRNAASSKTHHNLVKWAGVHMTRSSSDNRRNPPKP